MKVGTHLPKLGIGAGVVAIVRGTVLRSLALVVIGVALVVFSAYKLWRDGRKPSGGTPPSSPPPAAPRVIPAGPEHIVAPPKALEPSAAPAPVVAPPAAEPSPDLRLKLMGRTEVSSDVLENFKRGAEVCMTTSLPFFFHFADCGSDVQSSHDHILKTSLKRCLHSITSSWSVNAAAFSTISYKSESSSTGIQAHQLAGIAPNGRHPSSAQVLKNFDQFGNFLFETIGASQVPVIISSPSAYSYCILGVKKPSQTTPEEQTRGLTDRDIILLIADPNKSSLEEAIYSVRFGIERTTGRIIVKDCSAEDRRGSIESIQKLLAFPSFEWLIFFVRI